MLVGEAHRVLASLPSRVPDLLWEQGGFVRLEPGCPSLPFELSVAVAPVLCYCHWNL